MKYLSFIVVVFVFIISGCTHHVPSQYDGAQIKYMDGVATKASVIADWGVPNVSFPVDKTSTAYQWNSDNGSSSVGAFDSSTVSSGAATSGTDCLGCGVNTFGLGSSQTSGATVQNIETHTCALSIIADNKTDKIKAAHLVGTVDDKCYAHFYNALTLNQKSVNAHNAEVSHNKNVATTKAIIGILAVIGGGAAVYNANH
ncbi:hypothetical protein CHU32_10130 [Superficieibacter electus]|uniref:Uncharacterized protein n=1 Tax=Superficieibacter electus TaxID=2022662 RepID=A0A2P5GQT8_9ENTR|nr:hypothetical protein [Superficieibacter electus]POP43426.1 hypothetical protein CHU33_16245 [Superficieibacter electus]POP48941.1 hypothetical protein CHU32_10130 [Superficieibacter electus]